MKKLIGYFLLTPLLIQGMTGEDSKLQRLLGLITSIDASIVLPEFEEDVLAKLIEELPHELQDLSIEDKKLLIKGMASAQVVSNYKTLMTSGIRALYPLLILATLPGGQTGAETCGLDDLYYARAIHTLWSTGQRISPHSLYSVVTEMKKNVLAACPALTQKEIMHYAKELEIPNIYTVLRIGDSPLYLDLDEAVTADAFEDPDLLRISKETGQGVLQVMLDNVLADLWRQLADPNQIVECYFLCRSGGVGSGHWRLITILKKRGLAANGAGMYFMNSSNYFDHDSAYFVNYIYNRLF